MGTDTLPDNSVVSGTAPRRSKAKTALIFLLIIAIFLLILWLVKSNSITSLFRKSVPAPNISFEKIDYTNSKAKDRILALSKKAQKENDPRKSYNDYQQLFTELSLVYNDNHDPNVRNMLINLRDFLSQNYPKYYNQNYMNISCFDTECGKADLSQKAAKIRDEIKINNTIDPVVNAGMQKNFESVSFTQDKDSQWNYLMAVYNSLTSEYRRTKTEDVRALALEMKDYLNSSYPTNYKIYEKIFPDIFKL